MLCGCTLECPCSWELCAKIFRGENVKKLLSNLAHTHTSHMLGISMVDAGSNDFIFKIKLLNNVLNSDSVGSALCVISCFSHVWLFATVWTIAHQVPLSTGFSRQEYKSGFRFLPAGYLPHPGIECPLRLWFPGQENPLEKEVATHSSICAWRNPWTEEPGRLQAIGSQRVGHNWVTNTLGRL